MFQPAQANLGSKWLRASVLPTSTRSTGFLYAGLPRCLPLTTLPAIAWEPMYNRAKPGSDTASRKRQHTASPARWRRPAHAAQVQLCHADSYLSLAIAAVRAGRGQAWHQRGNLTLPFGMVGALSTDTINGTVLPNLSLVQPVFPGRRRPPGLSTPARGSSVLPRRTQPD